jgi:hypothetical protein
MQKAKPGAMAKVLSTHPMDSERIDKTEKEIQAILPARPEYVVTTSEYRAVRERVLARDAGRKPESQDGAPVLRRRSTGNQSDDPAQPGDRPTIKRRDLIE